MSIEYYAYLGTELDNLESRFISCFHDYGFDILLHPEMSLLANNQRGCLAIAVSSTPSYLNRASKDTPLFTSFGYTIAPFNEKNKKITRKLKKCTYIAYTRTSSGRSRCDAYMQQLTSAILAKVTQGLFYSMDGDIVMTGDEAIEQVISELRNLENKAKEAIAELKELEEEPDAAPWRIQFTQERTDPAFDSDAIPFDGWPPLESYSSYSFSKPIRSYPAVFNPNPNAKRKKPIKPIKEKIIELLNLFRQDQI
ncbi:hypothetical protein [Chitinibacter sp. S2-10]|uniref:hypothetical protein n=1 Tax=Chitinibacter sp. S2-10 TaxID=3373597 RepID=UPI003977A167